MSPQSSYSGTENGILPDPGEAITQMLSLSESLRESVALAVTDSLSSGTNALVTEWNEGWERYDWESTRWCQWGHLVYEQRMSEPGERRDVITDQLGDLFAEAGMREPRAPVWRPAFARRWDEHRAQGHATMTKLREHEITVLQLVGVFRDLPISGAVAQQVAQFMSACESLANHCPMRCSQIKNLTACEWDERVAEGRAKWGMLTHELAEVRRTIEKLLAMFVGLRLTEPKVEPGVGVTQAENGKPQPKAGGKQTKGANANPRMLKKLSEDPSSFKWSARQWGEFLRVTASTVKECEAWESVMNARKLEAAHRVSRDRQLDGGRRRQR